MATNKILHSDLPIPPGEYLEEVLEELGIPKHELAKRMNRPAPKLSAIFKGQKVITPDTAIQLEKVVGVPAHIWTGLESDYRLALARRKKQEDRQRLKEDNHLVTRFCYSELVKHGVIQKKNKQTDKVLELHGFFGVNSLKTVLELQRYRSAFRAGKQERSPEAVAAWLRVGELRSVRKQCAPYNDKKLKVQLQTIRRMTTRLPEQFEAELDEVLVSCGISLVLFPQFRGTYANGATFWIGKQKAVVMMTIRYGWADIFWFSLFHELGHILMHKRQLGNIGGKWKRA